MQFVINGKERDFPALPTAPTIADLLHALQLKDDRVALEHNGGIVRRDAWSGTVIQAGDKFEIVHFVGGGCAASAGRELSVPSIGLVLS